MFPAISLGLHSSMGVPAPKLEDETQREEQIQEFQSN